MYCECTAQQVREVALMDTRSGVRRFDLSPTEYVSLTETSRKSRKRSRPVASHPAVRHPVVARADRSRPPPRGGSAATASIDTSGPVSVANDTRPIGGHHDSEVPLTPVGPTPLPLTPDQMSQLANMIKPSPIGARALQTLMDYAAACLANSGAAASDDAMCNVCGNPCTTCSNAAPA